MHDRERWCKTRNILQCLRLYCARPTSVSSVNCRKWSITSYSIRPVKITYSPININSSFLARLSAAVMYSMGVYPYTSIAVDYNGEKSYIIACVTRRKHLTCARSKMTDRQLALPVHGACGQLERTRTLKQKRTKTKIRVALYPVCIVNVYYRFPYRFDTKPCTTAVTLNWVQRLVWAQEPNFRKFLRCS